MSEIIESRNIAIYNFLDEQLDLFKNLFSKIKTSIDEDTIHQMRVAVKKIRTIQKLKKHINFPSIINKLQFKAIKEIFAVSGRMRDLQIQQNLLGSYTSKNKFSLRELNEYLDSRQETIESELHQKIRETNFGDFTEIKKAANSDGEKPPADIENESVNFLELKMNTINRLIFALNQNEHVHDLRKELKQLFFILQFLKNHFGGSDFGAYTLKSLRKITDRIGQWNDRDVFDNMLQEFINRHNESFLLENPEYTILQYILQSEKGFFLRGIEVDIYLELAKLKAMIQKAG